MTEPILELEIEKYMYAAEVSQKDSEIAALKKIKTIAVTVIKMFSILDT